MKPLSHRIAILVLALPLLLLGCGSGNDGAPGAPGTSSGTISGTVTNSANAAGVDGAAVTATAGPVTATTQTSASGTYALSNLPAGTYSVTFSKANFTVSSSTVSVLAGIVTTANKVLSPVAPVILAISTSGSAVPGGTVTATVTPTIVDGSTLTGILWSQSNSVPVVLTDETTPTVTAALPAVSVYKDELFKVIAEPPAKPELLPPTVPLPPGEFPSGLQDRFQVQYINPYQLEEAGLVTLKAEVTTTSGTYSKEVQIHAALPWKINPGLRNVPVNIPVLLHGGTRGGVQATWSWSLSVRPVGSAAALDNASAQNPAFTPDVAGRYVASESGSGKTIEIYAGNWMGAITGQGADGRPNSANCTPCHNGIIATDKFTPWRLSGHAEIFGASNPGATANINTSTHYSTDCLSCHTVGYDTAAANGGFDDASGYSAFLASFTTDGTHFIADPNNWTRMLDNVIFQPVAQRANIQCENCHGPQQTLNINDPGAAHVKGDPRINVSSEVCGSCHGEPLRHARYQQWQLSPHANFELAIGEGDDGNCSRCHTAQGFIAWEKVGFAAGTNVTVTWDNTTVQPQTCAACHNPHNPGTTTGSTTNATVRVQDDTPVLAAGYRVLNAGRGAICMVCHNTRRNLINDDIPQDVITGGRAPHGGAQADVLMGQNAFFVAVGVRGKHSLITDTCANCHMVKTPPPAILSYSQGGTNHTFYADPAICSKCHASITAAEVQSATENQMSFLKTSLEGKLAEMILAYVAAGDNVTLTGMTDPINGSALPNVRIFPGDTVSVANFSDSHGRQAVDVTVNGVAGHLQLQNIKVNLLPQSGPVRNIMTFNAAGGNGPGELLAKAGWNYLMATNERSHGIHNPTFSLQILAGAQTAVDSIQP